MLDLTDESDDETDDASDGASDVTREADDGNSSDDSSERGRGPETLDVGTNAQIVVIHRSIFRCVGFDSAKRAFTTTKEY